MIRTIGFNVWNIKVSVTNFGANKPFRVRIFCKDKAKADGIFKYLKVEKII